MAVDADLFRQTLRQFASGVTVVTAGTGTRKTGLTVSAFSSVSLTPPYVLVCIDKRSTTLDVLNDTKVFAIHILADDQAGLSNQFASRSVDKFAGVPHHEGQLSVPVIEGVLAAMECSLVNPVDAGDHVICIGQVEHAYVNTDKAPLAYYAGTYRGLTEPLA